MEVILKSIVKLFNINAKLLKMKKLIYLFVMVAGMTLASVNVNAQEAKAAAGDGKKSATSACCAKGTSSAACCDKMSSSACTKKEGTNTTSSKAKTEPVAVKAKETKTK